jgi:hypothetical protein
MKPHVHDRRLQSRELTSLEEPSLSASGKLHRRRRVLLSMLSILLSLAGGFLTWLGEGLGFLSACLLVAIAAYRLRSWWALLIVPALYALGLTIGAVLLPLLQGGWPALQARIAEHFEPLDMIVFLGSWLVLLCTGLGVIVSRRGRRPQ